MNRSNNPRPTQKPESKEEDEEMLLLNLENVTAATRSVMTPCKQHDNKKRALPETSMKKDNLRAEIAMMRAQREMANKAHAKEVEEKEQRIRLLDARVKMLRKDFHKHAVVHRYAAELKDENVPSYIVVLQAKLCREVHHMCVDEAQLKLAKRISAKLAKFANKQMMDLEQERSELEVQVLNSMAQLEIQQKELQQEYSEKVREQRLKVVDIQKEIGQQESWEEESGIDNIMDRLSMLNTKLKYQAEPQDELTMDDLKMDRETSNHSLDEMLASEKSLHNSWNAPSDGKDVVGKQPRRGSGMLGATMWKSEKVWR